MINWDPLLERHILGSSPLGKVWIRVDRENKVTGMYTLFGTTEKYMPGEDYTIDDAKLELEERYKIEIAAIELSNKLKKH